MTTTTVAKVDDAEVEAEVLEPLTKREATALNKKIQKSADQLGTDWTELLAYVEQAHDGQIHKALGYKSWTAYFAENVQGRMEITDKNERKLLTNFMAGKGMSQRAIAASLGESQATVSRDLDGQADTDTPTEGLDGREYKRKSKADTDSDEEPIDVDEVTEVPVPTRRGALPKLFDASVTAVIESVNELVDLTEDDRFPKARKALGNKLGDDILLVLEGIHEVLDKLGIEYETEVEEAEDEEAEDVEAEDDSADE